MSAGPQASAIEAMRSGARQPRAIAEAVTRLTSPLFRRRGFADAALVAEWPAIVGDHLARVSTPEKVSFPARGRTGGTLRLRVASGGLALELQHLQPELIARVNTYFGYGAIARLQFVHGPIPRRPGQDVAPPRPLSRTEEAELGRVLAVVADPELRDALDSFGRSVIGRRPAGPDGEGTGAAKARDTP